jgi:hypothetical protein
MKKAKGWGTELVMDIEEIFYGTGNLRERRNRRDNQ